MPANIARHHLDDTSIARARTVNISDIATARGLVLTKQGCELIGPCPLCGGRDRFAIHVRKDVFHCRGCGDKGGSAISFVMWLDNVSFRTAVEMLVGPAPDGIGETEHARDQRAIERTARETVDLERSLRYCDSLWRASVPLPPVAVAYFVKRGIDINAVPDQGGLRFHAACPFGGAATSCIIARYTDAATNKPGGLWRRPVSGEKAKAIGPIRGRVIRLWPDEYVEQGLVIGEGIETRSPLRRW